MKIWIVCLILVSISLVRSQVPGDLQKIADQGDATAQYSIGDMYYEGQGVTKDPAQAMQWYKKAADQGNSDAKAKIAQITNAPASAAP